MKGRIVLALGIIVVVAFVVLGLVIEKPKEAVGETGVVQLNTIYSSSSTLPTSGEIGFYCRRTWCPSVTGTNDIKVSATSTGGTFLTNGTTTVLQLDTNKSSRIALNLIHIATSTNASNTVNVSFEASNDRIDWYPHNYVDVASVSSPPANSVNLNVGATLTGSSPTIASWRTLQETSSTTFVQRLLVNNITSRWIRVNVALFNPAITNPITASGTIRIEATRLDPL